MDKLKLLAAVFTPFDDKGFLNLEVIRVQAQRLIDDDVDGAFVCGTTGEGMSMTIDERKAVAAKWMDEAGKKLQILVHVGHACLADARDLAAHAQAIGAAGIAAVPPFFLKPVNAEDVAACMVKVAEAAPHLPFYYYHVPMATGINIPASEVVARLDGVIPNFAGVKYTGDDLVDLEKIAKLCLPKHTVYFGRDDLLIDAMNLGVRGAVGMSYNFAGKHFRRLFRAYQAGDRDRAASLQSDAKTMVSLAFPHGLANVLKAISVQARVNCGPTRLPLHTISSEELKDILETSGASAAIERLLS
ncbi:dihydrodipicolinate synthase family protein [Trinickia mobilis]|uniref:dihydrodipicolinate synthase family protein n=1 Tax=Trinickia mobilis TaxID=2816356 RepID=UPI0028682CB6|nr:dihydrodipicolinate synthase family protein [Trinickia mobilis]